MKRAFATAAAGLALALAITPAFAIDRRDEPAVRRQEEQRRQDERRYERDHRPAPLSPDGGDDVLGLGLGAILGGALLQGQQRPGIIPSPAYDPVATPMADCPGQWESPQCLSIVAAASDRLAQRFAGALERRGDAPDADAVRRTCAAASSPSDDPNEAVPAFMACNEGVKAVTRRTGLSAAILDQNLLGGPLACLIRDPRCGPFERALGQFRR